MYTYSFWFLNSFKPPLQATTLYVVRWPPRVFEFEKLPRHPIGELAKRSRDHMA